MKAYVLDTVDAVANRRGKYKLDYIVAKLSEWKQRATYGAVAELVGVPPQSLMRDRPRSSADSWIVATDTGIPTGYAEEDIDPDCLQQIRVLRERGIISEAKALEWW